MAKKIYRRRLDHLQRINEDIYCPEDLANLLQANRRIDPNFEGSGIEEFTKSIAVSDPLIPLLNTREQLQEQYSEIEDFEKSAVDGMLNDIKIIESAIHREEWKLVAYKMFFLGGAVNDFIVQELLQDGKAAVAGQVKGLESKRRFSKFCRRYLQKIALFIWRESDTQQSLTEVCSKVLEYINSRDTQIKLAQKGYDFAKFPNKPDKIKRHIRCVSPAYAKKPGPKKKK